MPTAWTAQAPGTTYMPKVLLIEDDPKTACEIIGELAQGNLVVDWAATGTDGLAKARQGGFDVLIVDRVLPGIDGLSLIETLRKESVRTPALMLSAMGTVTDRVRGLRAGGDDYLAKPFAAVELLARTEALTRRSSAPSDTSLRTGPLSLDLITRVAVRGERRIDLMPREFKLLEYMMRREGQLLTRTMLLENIWNYRFVPQSNPVDVHIGRLRRKIEQADELPLIHCVRGQGFILRAPA
jgi:two-component system OmpR family response regulator